MSSAAHNLLTSPLFNLIDFSLYDRKTEITGLGEDDGNINGFTQDNSDVPQYVKDIIDEIINVVDSKKFAAGDTRNLLTYITSNLKVKSANISENFRMFGDLIKDLQNYTPIMN